MTCTVLVENTTQDAELIPQHGLSLFIETSSAIILLDSGQNDAFARNAAILGKNIAAVDFAVCSHGHYDHSGGFSVFCTTNHHAPVYTYWDGVLCYSSARMKPGESPHSIGWVDAENYAQRIQKLPRTSPVLISEGVWFVPIVIHSSSVPAQNKSLYAVSEGMMHHDDFSHEGILAIKTCFHGRQGFVLFNSCSHNGVVNSIKSVQHFFPGMDIISYIGGFHFPGEPGESLAREDYAGMNELAEYCGRTDTILYTGHCTGALAFNCLDQLCHERLHHLYTGLSISL
jgi:7,8-dihydropterin-6-yl-methyl-4-(beta-D-ribofuranosyl)aminobenzene 5'-phosphate synthase